MPKIARTIPALAIAAALSSPAGAQGVVTQKSISLPMAQTIANAVIAKCQSMGFKISVSVLDRGGLALVMLRDEGASLHTVESSDRKAYTARTFRQPSAAIVKRIQDEPAVAGFKEYTRVIALAGGLPIKVGDDVIGAVGVSGSPGKDDDCAQAGIDKVADQLK
jgi:uncharacterized protein GlcG (DUF336 family)